MCIIRMKSKTKRSGTLVPNVFIDRYMNRLDGSYVCVYLYLLRHYTGDNLERRDPADLSIAAMAEKFDCLEKEIHRALRALEKIGLLEVSFDEDNRVNGIELVDLFETEYEEDAPARSAVAETMSGAVARASVPAGVAAASDAKPADDLSAETDYAAMERAFVVTPEIQDRFLSDASYDGLTDILQALTGATLSQQQYRLVLFAYDRLNFPRDLIIYLFEYCIEIQKAAPRYMTAVALGWAADGVFTEEDAKLHVSAYDSLAAAVRKEFGSSPSGESQRNFLTRWGKVWGMSAELVKEACGRTMAKTGKASYSYADKILSDWHELGLTTLAQVNAKENERRDSADADREGGSSRGRKSRTAAGNGNLFTDYTQREYSAEDYAALELAMRNRH